MGTFSDSLQVDTLADSSSSPKMPSKPSTPSTATSPPAPPPKRTGASHPPSSKTQTSKPSFRVTKFKVSSTLQKPPTPSSEALKRTHSPTSEPCLSLTLTPPPRNELPGRPNLPLRKQRTKKLILAILKYGFLCFFTLSFST